MKNTKKLLWGIPTVLLLIVLGVIAFRAFSYHEVEGALYSQRLTMGKELAKEGAIDNAETWVTIASLQDEATQTGHIADEKLTWLISQLHSPSTEPQIVHARILATFSKLRNASSSQKIEIYNAVYPLLEENDPQDTYGIDKSYGCTVMRKLDQKQAVPIIEKILKSDSRPAVLLSAKRALNVLATS